MAEIFSKYIFQNLSKRDKLVFKFVDKKKKSRNWIAHDIFYAILKKRSEGDILSKSEVEYSLRKLVRLGIIKTEKWEMVHKRVYWI